MPEEISMLIDELSKLESVNKFDALLCVLIENLIFCIAADRGCINNPDLR